jgi:endonuclease G
MKNLLLSILLIFLWGCTAEAQDLDGELRDSVTIENEIFKIGYSEVLENPLWVEYQVLCPKPGVSRGGMDFYEVDGIHTSDDADYYKNEWDKGHMAPAAAFNCTKEMLLLTFSYVNSAVQHESLNRGVWNKLEEFERNLANFYEVRVRIDVIFGDNPKRLPSNAAIPTHFKKTISFDGREEVFIFPNEDTSGTDWTDYHIE